jgi:glutathione S-transferase
LEAPKLRLHHTSASPFVRKVVASAIELGLDHHISFIPAENPTIPTARNPAITANNPLSKVPTLILPSGEALFDSIVICEYLDALDGGHKLFPIEGTARWRVLKLNALADGIIDAGVAVRLERIRPAHLQWADWVDGHLFKIKSALNLLESDSALFGGSLTIGQIALASALSWLNFRNVHVGLAESHPCLYRWHAEFEKRESMMRTKPT